MTKSKKNTKKYELSRSDIVERISDILENLEGIDTVEDSPNSVSLTISDAVSELQQLQDDVTDEKYEY